MAEKKPSALEVLGEPILTDIRVDEPVMPDDPPALKKAKLAAGQPVYDPTTDTYDREPLKAVRNPNVIPNVVLGALKAIPKMAEPERYIKTYKALEERQDKLLKTMEQARESGPFSGALEFSYNVLRDAGDIAAAAFVLSDALGTAADKSPEDVAEFLSTIPPAIAAGTYQAVSDFDESIATDPVGTVLTFTGLGSLARASKLAPAIAAAARRAPEPIRSRAEASFAGMEKIAKKVGNMKMEDVLNSSTPISRGEKIVGEGAPRRRLDVPSGEEALKVGDLIRGAAVPALVGFGSYGVPGAVAGMLGSAAIRTGVSAAKSAGPNFAGEYIAKLERLVKGTSRAQNISEGIAKSVIMAEAAKEGGRLNAQLQKIEDAIRAGDLDNARFYMQNLDRPISVKEVRTKIKPGQYGVSGEMRARDFRSTSPQQQREIPATIRGPLNDALRLIDNISGNRGKFVNNEVNRIARLESPMLLGSRAVRQGVLRDIEKTSLGRKLTNDEARIIISTMNKMASLAKLTNKKIVGRVDVPLKGGKTLSVNLDRHTQRVMKNLQPKSQRDVIIQAIGSVMQKEMSAIRSQAFINAIEDSAMLPARNRRYAGRSLEDQLKEFSSLPEGSRPAYVRADVLREYAEAVAESVVLRGGTVPLAMPRGVSFRQVRDILDTPAFQQYFRAKHGIKSGDKNYDNAMRGLIDGMPNGVRIGDNATVNIFKSELDDLRASMADLKSAGGLLDDADLKFLDDLEASFAMQRGPRADKHNGPEVHPELHKTLDYVHNWKADTKQYARVLNTMAALWKAARTLGSVGTGIINNLANSMISSIENGVFIPQMYMKYVDELVQQSRFNRGDRKGFTPDEIEFAKMTDDLGFSKGDMTNIEIRNFLRASDVNSVLSRGKLDKLIDEAAYWFSSSEVGNFVKQGAKSTGRNARRFYSAGDTVPKRVHAKAAMRETVDEVRKMEPGTVMFIRTNENALRMIKRTENGTWTYNGRRIFPDNLAAKQNKTFRDAIMANARRRANDRFVDFGSRPGIMRAIDRWGLSGAIADPFITWSMKAKGIGGPNLFSTVMGLNRPEYITNSAAVNRSLATKRAMKRLRSSAILHSTKVDQASDSRRDALDLLNAWASKTSLGTLAGLETEGMASVRDLGNLVSTNEAAKLHQGVLKILASIFEESPDSAVQFAAMGKPDSPVWNAVANTLDVLGFATNSTMIEVVNNLIANDARKNQRAWRELRKTAMSTTGNEVFEYIVGLLKDNEVLPEWATEMLPTTYFDYIHKNTPTAMRPSRLRHFFERNSGRLLSEQAFLWSNQGNWGKPGKIQKNAKRIKENLIKIYYNPVAKDGTPEEMATAWRDIADWYNGMLDKAQEGVIKSVQKSSEPMSDLSMRRFMMVISQLRMSDIPPLPSLRRLYQQKVLMP